MLFNLNRNDYKFDILVLKHTSGDDHEALLCSVHQRNSDPKLEVFARSSGASSLASALEGLLNVLAIKVKEGGENLITDIPRGQEVDVPHGEKHICELNKKHLRGD